MRMRVFLDMGVSINARCSDGNTVLHYLCDYPEGHLAVFDRAPPALQIRQADEQLRLAIRAGANLEAEDGFGYTPLIHALTGMAGVPPLAIKTLVQLGCNIKVVDEDGLGALHFTAESNMPGTMQFFIDKGLDINQQTFDGGTPLHLSDIRTMPILLRNGANMGLKNKLGLDPQQSRVQTDLLAMDAAWHEWLAQMTSIWETEIALRR